MKPEHKEYFEAVLSRMPERTGYEKYVCGSLFHCDKDVYKYTEVCPQCGNPCHPATYYVKKKDVE